ncbi:Copia protein, partial [Camponotus floridanus]
QCNGMAERENRTLCDTARSLLFNTNLSKKDRLLLWTEAVGTAAYLRNRIPNRGIVNTTPYKEWY